MSDKETLLPKGKGVWIPIDHGVSDFPVNGLENLDQLIEAISHADAIVAQKGSFHIILLAMQTLLPTFLYLPGMREKGTATKCWSEV